MMPIWLKQSLTRIIEPKLKRVISSFAISLPDFIVTQCWWKTKARKWYDPWISNHKLLYKKLYKKSKRIIALSGVGGVMVPDTNLSFFSPGFEQSLHSTVQSGIEVLLFYVLDLLLLLRNCNFYLCFRYSAKLQHYKKSKFAHEILLKQFLDRLVELCPSAARQAPSCTKEGSKAISSCVPSRQDKAVWNIPKVSSTGTEYSPA